ncbi:MAG: anthranilate phosphoribosyltransferase, partial [Proteobacteria bacterium]
MKHLLRKLFKGQILTREEAREAMEKMMEGSVSPEEVAGFLGAIAARGESSQELVGCVEAMRARALPFVTKRHDLIDVCGTGGDDLGTFNISTTNALLLSALGLGVVKHGNRAVSSQSGSADVLEKLGIPITGDRLQKDFESKGFVFLFAPDFHPAMKHVGP